MRHLRLAFAAAAAVAFVGPYRPAADAQNGSAVTWLTDTRKAFEESRKTGKPLWVLFR